MTGILDIVKGGLILLIQESPRDSPGASALSIPMTFILPATDSDNRGVGMQYGTKRDRPSAGPDMNA